MLLKRCEKIELLVLAAMVIASVLNVTVFAAECDVVRTQVLRLHVIANSDSDADQQLKLAVRDAVLERGDDIFDGTVTADEATEKITPRIAELREAALEVMRNAGCEYGVTVEVGKEYFGTRKYDEFVMPAGEYMAVRVILGEGAGRNWWCVMFPPMCLPAAEKDLDAYLTSGGVKVVEAPDSYAPAFKIVEVAQRLRGKK